MGLFFVEKKIIWFCPISLMIIRLKLDQPRECQKSHGIRFFRSRVADQREVHLTGELEGEGFLPVLCSALYKKITGIFLGNARYF